MDLQEINEVVRLHWLSERLGNGLLALLAAARYSICLPAQSRQMAVPLAELAAAGFEITDCRWLILQGFLEHLTETTFPGDEERSFRLGDATVNSRSSFLLTDSGVVFAERMIGDPDSSGVVFQTRYTPTPTTKRDQTPRWDVERQELWYEGRMIKQYRIPSPNQVAILCAFEEEGWPAKIDDPLPSHPEIDSRRRLNDAIRNLNRSRIVLSIRFAGDGSGQGILWEPEVAKHG
ncbi:MAG: hypothetical protein U0892_04350 [Pirellulales bacterium]